MSKKLFSALFHLYKLTKFTKFERNFPTNERPES